MGSIARGKSKHRPRDDGKLYGGNYPFIQTGDIRKALLYLHSYDNTYSEFGLKQSKLWEIGTLCITIAANIAETALLGVKACFPDSIIGFQSNSSCVNLFVKYYFDFLKSNLMKLSVGGAQDNLNLEKLQKIKFRIPTKTEQTKIATLLSLIDQRIETQNKIIEDLKLLKNSLCAILLHNKNWEKQKIGDISKLGRGRVISTTKINIQKRPKYPVYSSQTSNNGIMGYLDSYDFAGEYLTWTTDGANAGTVFYRNGKFNCTNVCGTIQLQANYDAYFLCHQLQRSTQKFVSSNLANPKLMNNTMANIQISVPLYDIQVKFGYVFKLFDDKIILENIIIDNYKKQKKHLLNNLFI